jgi:anti-sigma factor RsiW
MSVCRRLLHLLGPYADGELEVEKQAEVQVHVEECADCRERVALARAMRGTLQRVVKTEAPSALRARAIGAMKAEAARNVARAQQAEQQRAQGKWRTFVPLATAAAFALMWGAMSRGTLRTTEADTARAGVNDELLEELVAEHSRPLPLHDAKDPSEAQKLEPYVGVPVRAASFQKRAGGRFVGGRVLPVHQERAAMLQYEIEDGQEMRRVSVIVFDPRRIQVRDAELEPRPVGTAQVHVGRANGYTVAVTQREGVGYAVASDLDESKTAELAVYTAGE